jgi:hypothetical protein
MGKIIKQNKDGLYKVQNTVSDEYYFDGKWVTEDEVKKLFIEERIFKFLESVAEVEVEFLLGWQINGKLVRELEGKEHFSGWWLRKQKEGTLDEDLYKIVKDLLEKYDMKNYIEPLIKE